jgi:Zn-dependent protease
MFFTIRELIDAIIMSAVVGYIFSDMLARFRPVRDPLLEFRGGFNWENFKFALYITVPAILLHELGHKFFALSFGMQAVFNAAYGWLGIGVVLKLMNFPFIFFVPAYVSIAGPGTPLQFALIAGAGPMVNGLLWAACAIAMRLKPKRRYVPLIFLTGRINMFLFIFNLIPIPGFDGYQFFSGLLRAFTG